MLWSFLKFLKVRFLILKVFLTKMTRPRNIIGILHSCALLLVHRTLPCRGRGVSFHPSPPGAVWPWGPGGPCLGSSTARDQRPQWEELAHPHATTLAELLLRPPASSLAISGPGDACDVDTENLEHTEWASLVYHLCSFAWPNLTGFQLRVLLYPNSQHHFPERTHSGGNATDWSSIQNFRSPPR